VGADPVLGDPEDVKNALSLPPIDWSMHQPDEDENSDTNPILPAEPEDEGFNPPDVMRAFPPYSYASVRRALEDGTYEITSVDVADIK
jgi:hypothetical protein